MRSRLLALSHRVFPASLLAGMMSTMLMVEHAPAQNITPPPSPGQSAAAGAEDFAKDGHVWGGLIYGATKAPAAKLGFPIPAEMGDVVERLSKVFPYTHYEMLGQHNQVVFREYESWVVPSREVFIKVDSKGVSSDGGLNLHLQFWQGQNVLVKTDTVLRKNSPLFISGPKWRDGQIIFVLLLKDSTAGK